MEYAVIQVKMCHRRTVWLCSRGNHMKKTVIFSRPHAMHSSSLLTVLSFTILSSIPAHSLSSLLLSVLFLFFVTGENSAKYKIAFFLSWSVIWLWAKWAVWFLFFYCIFFSLLVSLSNCSHGSNRLQALIYFTVQPLSDWANGNFRVMACQVSIFLPCVKPFFFPRNAMD